MNRREILITAAIVDSICWVALGFLIAFCTGAL